MEVLPQSSCCSRETIALGEFEIGDIEQVREVTTSDLRCPGRESGRQTSGRPGDRSVTIRYALGLEGSGRIPHWFLSYHTPDRTLAERLKAAIERKDPASSVFFAPSSLRAGGAWTAQLAGELAEADAQTALVGSFPANRFGLYDMVGNVWEWTEDCWHESYQGAPPTNGSPWTTGGDCGRRVVRGGSWYFDPVNLRSAIRRRLNSVIRDYDLGFRVARTLTP